MSINNLVSIVRGESQKASGVCMSTLSIVQKSKESDPQGSNISEPPCQGHAKQAQTRHATQRRQAGEPSSQQNRQEQPKTPAMLPFYSRTPDAVKCTGGKSQPGKADWQQKRQATKQGRAFASDPNRAFTHHRAFSCRHQ